MKYILILTFLFSTAKAQEVRGDTLFVSEHINVISFPSSARYWEVDSSFMAQPVFPSLPIRVFIWPHVDGKIYRIWLFHNNVYKKEEYAIQNR